MLNSKESVCYAGDVGDVGSIPSLGRFPGGGHGKPSQCPCLENPIERSLEDYSPWGHKESDMTEVAEHTHTQIIKKRIRYHNF